MKVIKKLGNRQLFDENKIKKALKETSKEAGVKFTNKEWKEIKPRILSRIKKIEDKTEEVYFWEIDDVVSDALLRSRFNEIAKYYIKSKSKEVRDHLNDIGVSPAAMYVLKDRYLRTDENGEPIETVKEMFGRVATEVASVEKTKELRENYTNTYFNMLKDRDFLPNSPALVAAGSKSKGTYSACFAYGIEDSLDDILDTLGKTARTFQLGGGVGVSIAKLRERGSSIDTTNGESSGSVEFLKLFDVMCTTIKTGGFRRGALMCLTEYNHPDIEWFISCKKDVEQLNNMNISVIVDDKFFEAIDKKERINLISPKNNNVVGTIDANYLLDKIASNIWETGEPGILFYDRMNQDNPTPHLGDIRLTNPCLTSDSWVFSSYGPRQIRDLTDIEETHLLNNGEMYKSNSFFSTGIKDVFEICTNRGYKIKATPNHLISTYTVHDRYTKIKDWKRVDELQEGDIIELSNNRDNKEWLTFGQEWQGYLLGQIVSDGYIEKNRERANIKLWEADKGYEGVKAYIESILHNLNTKSDFKGFRKYKETYNLGCKQLYDMCKDYGISINKQLTPTIEKTSSEFYKGFLSGTFDGDGTVLFNKEKGSSIRLGQNNLKRLETIQRMLSRLGIVSTIYKNRHDEGLYPMPDGNGGLNEYFRKAMHELVISKDNMALFQQLIGFKNTNKKKRLESILKSYDRNIYKENFITYVTDIKYVGKEEVFDTNVEEVHSFDANGIIVHNCSESNLLPNEACNLGSINLMNHLNGPEGTEIDWDKLAITTENAVRFLDDMIDASPYPTKEVEEAVKKTRKIGVGVMGFADLLIKKNIKYSSNDAIEYANKIMGFVNDVAIEASKKLADEKGEYPAWKSKYQEKRRNAIVTIQAPTGTLSLIAGVSPGIEPNFHKTYKRQIADGAIVSIDHPLKNYNAFETAHEIPPEHHLKMLAEVQKNVENSVSKTINAPEHITIEEIKNLIIKAHRLGVKGVTIFRDNCFRPSLIQGCDDCKIERGEE
jgi:ribonucleoside-diphosphate reductase alpha chain